MKKGLAFLCIMWYYIQAVERQQNIRVWRSLVSRLNGVQEAAGSNPVTRTKIRKYPFGYFLIFYPAINSKTENASIP